VELRNVSDVEGFVEKYKVPPSTRLLTYDFVLVTDQETATLRDREAEKEIAKQNRRMRVVNGLPVLDVD
jgi:hypothetical protein